MVHDVDVNEQCLYLVAVSRHIDHHPSQHDARKSSHESRCVSRPAPDRPCVTVPFQHDQSLPRRSCHPLPPSIAPSPTMARARPRVLLDLPNHALLRLPQFPQHPVLFAGPASLLREALTDGVSLSWRWMPPGHPSRIGQRKALSMESGPPSPVAVHRVICPPASRPTWQVWHWLHRQTRLLRLTRL